LRVVEQEIVDGFTGSEFFQNQLDRDASARDDGLAQHNRGIGSHKGIHDVVSSVLGSLDRGCVSCKIGYSLKIVGNGQTSLSAQTSYVLSNNAATVRRPWRMP